MVYLIPSFLSENAGGTIPPSVMKAVHSCEVIFAENERTARRFLKSMDREIVIDNFEWFTIHKAEALQLEVFRQKIAEGKTIAIISEAGCPGVADPGQALVAAAQDAGYPVKPLVGPSSILLALMASGMNGQQFEFVGYLPIDNSDRVKKIRELESMSARHNSTKIFIETPYRNNQLFESLVQHCNGKTRLCIAVNLTAPDESVQTKTVAAWRESPPSLHKLPAIFLLYAGN